MGLLPVSRPQRAPLSFVLLALLLAAALHLASSQGGACSAPGTNPCGSGVCSEGPDGSYTCQCSSADGQVLFRNDDGTPSCGDFYGECHRPLLCGAGICTAQETDYPDGSSVTSYSCQCAGSSSLTENMDGNVQCIPGSSTSNATGLVEGGPFLPPTHLNPYSRHWSLWYSGTAATLDWNVPPSVDWRRQGVLPPVQNTFGCGASWAFAAAAAYESAWAITHNSPPPLVSRQQFLDCTSAASDSCQSGYPGDAFEYAAGLAERGTGLKDALNYQYIAAQANCTADIKVTGGNYTMGMYEKIGTGNWKQLAAAVAAQPVVVSMVGSYSSFMSYDGQSAYSDDTCYVRGDGSLPPLDHTVLVVGYSLPAEGDPFWIIQNSWGTQWGDRGYGYIAIQTEPGTPGICGIQVAPALYPVVRGSDPCAGINPCGNGTCTLDQSGGYQCACPALFVAVTSIDGTQTCTPVNVCQSFPSDPCAPGTCVNDNQGSYRCQCPQGFLELRQGTNSTCRPATPRLTGYNPDGPALPSNHLNYFSRHYSAFFSGSSTKPAWRIPRSHDWRRRPGVLPPVMDMEYCGASWAFSAAAAIESAWALTNGSPAPQVSRQELIDCVGEADACAQGSPVDAFEYVSSLTASGSGLSSASDYPYQGQTETCTASNAESGQPKYGVTLYEQVGTDSWQQLAAAVARQPVVVALVGSYPSFTRHVGKRVYRDQSCYGANSKVDHSVLLVGFSLPRRGLPFWIIQNSWGQSWGDQGYGYIKIQPGAGICGIQVTPAVYPVVQAPDPCEGLNPCGSGTCAATVSGGNSCTCPKLFVAATNVDGTQTCAPVNVCNYKSGDPCGSGRCIDDGRGFYRCFCVDPASLTLTTDGDPICVGAGRLSYVIQRGDTCEGIASWYMADLPMFRSINRNLDCSVRLEPGTLATIPAESESCKIGLTVQPGDTLSMWCGILYGLSADLQTCTNKLTQNQVDLDVAAHPVGSLICPKEGISTGPGQCGGQYRTVGLGDTCVSLYVKYYKRKPTLYTAFNLYPCTNKGLYVGKALCVP